MDLLKLHTDGHTCSTPVPSPVVLIMLLGVAVAAAKMLGVLPGVDAPPVVGVPTVLTDRLPGGGFLTGTTTLLLRMRHKVVVSQCRMSLSGPLVPARLELATQRLFVRRSIFNVKHASRLNFL